MRPGLGEAGLDEAGLDEVIDSSVNQSSREPFELRSIRNVLQLRRNEPWEGVIYQQMEAVGGARPETVCEEKGRLKSAYQVARGDYTRALAVLNRRRAVMNREEYARIWHFVEDARLRCKAAERALEQHISEHGCGSIDFKLDFKP